MFNPQQYRDVAADYSERRMAANGANEARKFEKLEKSFTVLAENEQWLADNHQNTVRTSEHGEFIGASLAEDEEHILRCLGAALIMQWNTLPAKLRRELFDNAGSMGEVMDTARLRAQIARFLHRQKDDVD